MREWFQRVTFTKKYSGDNIQKIIQTYNYRLIENQRELYLENGIKRTIDNYIQIITFRVLHSEKHTEKHSEIYITFISFSGKKEISNVYTKRYFKSLSGQKTLSNNDQRKSVIERKYLLRRYFILLYFLCLKCYSMLLT